MALCCSLAFILLDATGNDGNGDCILLDDGNRRFFLIAGCGLNDGEKLALALAIALGLALVLVLALVVLVVLDADKTGS